jgi:glutamine amidotransferase-like uncharacterized protein
MVNNCINQGGNFLAICAGRLGAKPEVSLPDVFNRSVENFVEKPLNITVRLNR